MEKLSIGGGSSNSTGDEENSTSSNGDVSQLEQECVSEKYTHFETLHNTFCDIHTGVPFSRGE